MSIKTRKCESCENMETYYECDQCGADIGKYITAEIMVVFGSVSKHTGQRRDFCSDECFGQSLKDMVNELTGKSK